MTTHVAQLLQVQTCLPTGRAGSVIAQLDDMRNTWEFHRCVCVCVCRYPAELKWVERVVNSPPVCLLMTSIGTGLGALHNNIA